MADEVVETKEPEAGEETIEVEIAPEVERQGKPELSDEEVAKLVEPVSDDEIGRYAKDAQKRIKNLHIVNQEWKRRVIQAGKDVSTATSLAEQLYRENQELKANIGRSETALIEQAVQRAEAQLAQAKSHLRAAHAANDPEAIVSANEEVARYVAEADRLKLLKPAAVKPRAGEESGPASSPSAAPAPPAQPSPVTPGVQAWIAKNPWFGKPGEEEITGFAMGVHTSLEKQGITELTNPEQYWAAIDRRLREVYPQRFGEKPAARGTTVEIDQPRRPVAVTGATRVNGGTATGKPRHVTLSESEVRIARALGLTPEQYAAQLVKEAKEKGPIQ